MDINTPIVVVGPDYLVPLLHRTLATIKVDARARPESLPPRLKIPGSAKLLWVEAVVLNWLVECQSRTLPAEKVSIFKGRKQ